MGVNCFLFDGGYGLLLELLRAGKLPEGGNVVYLAPAQSRITSLTRKIKIAFTCGISSGDGRNRRPAANP
jgi:hypothetical protein